jgi:ubiquinone/menaquinone biosynthesis C-methylase UbiE
VPDAIFEDRRLAEIYDPLDPERSDLDCYVAIVEEFHAHSVLDLGCGTGTFACLLSQRGKDVTGIDPAAASLDVARAKPFANQVRWITGDAQVFPATQVDMVTMTGNAAQVLLTDEEWSKFLSSTQRVLRFGGRLVFEVRDPAHEAWREWTKEQSIRRVDIPKVGVVETWVDLLDVRPPMVSFRSTYSFQADGVTLTSDSTLRFRDRAEISHSLVDAGFSVTDVRDAPDRPGREFVFVATKNDPNAR